MAREQKFDVSEMAIVTYLQAKAYGKPLVLLPATMMGRFQHGTLLYNSERGTLRPDDLPGRRVGVRSFSQTTGVWIRGILWKDYGLDLGTVKWVTFEDAHVAEYRDPPGVERAAAGKDITKMLLDGELDAAIFGGAMPTDPQLKSVIPDPEAAAKEWYKKNGTVPVNHMVVVRGKSGRVESGDGARSLPPAAREQEAAGLPKAGRDRPRPVRFRCGKTVARTHERLRLRDEAHAAPLFGRGIVRRHDARAASLTTVAASACPLRPVDQGDAGGAFRAAGRHSPTEKRIMTVAKPKAQQTAGGRLAGKAAIVTGAARGIGRAVAVAFAREGADVMGIDIAGPVSATLEVVPATRGELVRNRPLGRGGGQTLVRSPLDQRDLSALRAAAAKARASFGRLDILFANAGIQMFKPILEWEDADWHDQIDVNLTGTCNAIRAVAPHLVANGGGRIIVTSSTQGRHGTKYGAAYSASKWGIIGLMKSAALEFGEHKITVNALIPGLIDTPLTRHRQRYEQAVDDLRSKQPTAVLEEEARKRLIAKTPLGVPWIEPEAIAPAVVFLASDEASMVSGATYDVTGGDSASYTA